MLLVTTNLASLQVFGFSVPYHYIRSLCTHPSILMMTSSNGNSFRVTGPLWGESTGHRWMPLTRGALMFALTCTGLNCWTNHRDAGDLRRHRTHYNVIVLAREVTRDIVRFGQPSEQRQIIEKDVEVCEWINSFITHFTRHMITYPCWD